MRPAATAARDHGANLAFLGGNEVYRHIRFAATPLGPNRLEINYKSFGEDPASTTDPLEATQDWRLPPHPRPESVLAGNYYYCFPGRADARRRRPGQLAAHGHRASRAEADRRVGIEYAKREPVGAHARPMQVLFHSPVLCGTTKQHEFSDAVYYTTPSGAGVFSSGTQGWVCGSTPPARTAVATRARAGARRHHHPTTAAVHRRPRRAAHPAVDNLARLGITANSPTVNTPDMD